MIRVHEVGGEWFDIGTARRFLEATGHFLGERGGPYIADSASVGGRPEGRLFSIDAGAEVGDGCLLEGSVVMEGATVGASCRLVDSIVCPGAKVPSGFDGSGKVLDRGGESPLEVSDVRLR